jgi:hypothetical protein
MSRSSLRLNQPTPRLRLLRQTSQLLHPLRLLRQRRLHHPQRSRPLLLRHQHVRCQLLLLFRHLLVIFRRPRGDSSPRAARSHLDHGLPPRQLRWQLLSQRHQHQHQHQHQLLLRLPQRQHLLLRHRRPPLLRLRQ